MRALRWTRNRRMSDWLFDMRILPGRHRATGWDNLAWGHE